MPQFAAAGPAAGVRLHEELHLHHRETLRPLQPEVWAPGRLQRGLSALLVLQLSDIIDIDSELIDIAIETNRSYGVMF